MSIEKHPLHIKDPELQKSEDVQDAVEKQERLDGERIPNDPTDRIEAYMDRLENIFLNPDERVRERNLEMLRDKIYDALIIKPENFPESYFELQQRVARERGQPVEHIPEATREQMKQTAIEDQRHSLDQWIDYLTSDDAMYPTWFKYYVWKNIAKLSQFDKERGEFKKRTSSTVAPYPDIYREPLAQLADLYDKVKQDNKTLKDEEVQKLFSKKFPSAYAELIQKTLEHQQEGNEEIKGEWIKYEHGNSYDAERLYKSLENKGTGWCTAGRSTAQTQIESGDFYVYYTHNDQDEPTQPRIAIRMQDNHIGEVRGVLPHQNLEPVVQPILEEKLKEFGTEAEAYKKKSEDMRLLTEIDQKINSDILLTKEDLVFLYEIDSPIQGFGYGKDPRISTIIKGRSIKEDLAEVFECSANEISTTREEAVGGNIKFHYGDLELSSFEKDPSESLILPEYVGGDLYLNGITSAEGLTFPKSVRGGLGLRRLTSAEGLILPEHIGGYLYLNNITSAKDLTLPKTVGGDLYLNRLSSAEGLTLPESVGESLYLSSLTSAEGLILPKSVGKDLDLGTLTSAEGLTLPESVGNGIYLNSLISVKNLTFPKSLNGEIELSALTSAENLTFPEYVRGSIYIFNLGTAKRDELKKLYPNLRFVQ